MVIANLVRYLNDIVRRRRKDNILRFFILKKESTEGSFGIAGGGGT